jgi:hypothetical protein
MTTINNHQETEMTTVKNKNETRAKVGCYGLVWGKEPEDAPSPQQIRACQDFLELCGKKSASLKSVKGLPSSYGIKHVVEKVFGIYIPNGAIILAACADEYPVRACEVGNPNAYIGLHLDRYRVLSELGTMLKRDRMDMSEKDSEAEKKMIDFYIRMTFVRP